MVGYLGPSSSFTYFAAKSICDITKLQAYSNISDLFHALHEDQVEGIIVPLENSIEGSVTLVIDYLLEHNIHISKEIIMNIELSLISKAKDISQIKHVCSHPHAHAQCRNTLTQHLGSYTALQTGSTSQAVKDLEELDATYAAIASKNTVAGDLNILLEDIGDNHNNKTRFIYVTKTLQVMSNHNKSSIICAAKSDASGALYDILHEFAIRGINLTKIESRPSKNHLGSYVFHIDLIGNINNDNIQDALSILKHKTKFLKILGSYYSEMA